MSDKKQTINAKNAQSASIRTRNYATVVYPESAPDNWKDIISESKIPCFISPLHDKDINPTGEPKKPHYHVLVMYDGPKTKEQAKSFFDTFGGVGCEVVNSVRGYARYLKHLDNPEKHQYQEDVICYGGADYMQLIGTAADKEKASREMIAWIEENDIISYRDLMVYAASNRSDWFNALITNSSYAIIEYIKSRYWQIYTLENQNNNRQ